MIVSCVPFKEWKKISAFDQILYVDPFKNIRTRLTGEYQDIKFYLAFRVAPSRTSALYIGELQINTRTTLMFKEDVSHKFYEVFRTFSYNPNDAQIRVLEDDERRKLVKDLRHAANSLSAMDAHEKLKVSGAPGARAEIPGVVRGRAAANLGPREVRYAIRSFVRDKLLGYERDYSGYAILDSHDAAFLRDHVAPLVWEDHQARGRNTMVYSNGAMVPLRGGRAIPEWLSSWR